jgi:hypothetical protein
MDPASVRYTSFSRNVLALAILKMRYELDLNMMLENSHGNFIFKTGSPDPSRSYRQERKH